MAAWGLLALLLTGPPSSDPDVSGKVTISGRPARDAVVYLTGGRKAEPLPRAVVDQRERTFVPHVSVITAGTTVEFPNNDRVFHNVYAAFEAKRFDLGMYPRGKTLRQRFDKPGLVVLLCNVHSEMSAFIVVVDTPYHAVTDGKGRFKIRGVPAGEYTLRGWHESGATEDRKVRVGPPDSGVNVELKKK